MTAERLEKRAVIHAEEISLDLLVLLAALPPSEREGWVDTYIVGVPQRDLLVSPADPSRASLRMRKLLGSPEAVRVFA